MTSTNPLLPLTCTTPQDIQQALDTHVDKFRVHHLVQLIDQKSPRTPTPLVIPLVDFYFSDVKKHASFDDSTHAYVLSSMVSHSLHTGEKDVLERVLGHVLNMQDDDKQLNCWLSFLKELTQSNDLLHWMYMHPLLPTNNLPRLNTTLSPPTFIEENPTVWTHLSETITPKEYLSVLSWCVWIEGSFGFLSPTGGSPRARAQDRMARFQSLAMNRSPDWWSELTQLRADLSPLWHEKMKRVCSVFMVLEEKQNLLNVVHPTSNSTPRKKI